MTRCSMRIAVLAFLAALPACASLQTGLSKLVLMDYDHVNSFRSFRFDQPFQWVDGSWSRMAGTGGFWAVFVVCNVRNEASQAVTFDYDVDNFYVEYDGEKHFYRSLQPDDYVLIGWPPNAPESALNGTLNTTFQQATRKGPDNKAYAADSYDPAANHRLAIFVETEDGQPEVDQPLLLRYQGHPNVTNPRNQPPMAQDSAMTANLGSLCRAQAQ